MDYGVEKGDAVVKEGQVLVRLGMTNID